MVCSGAPTAPAWSQHYDQATTTDFVFEWQGKVVPHLLQGPALSREAQCSGVKSTQVKHFVKIHKDDGYG